MKSSVHYVKLNAALEESGYETLDKMIHEEATRVAFDGKSAWLDIDYVGVVEIVVYPDRSVTTRYTEAKHVEIAVEDAAKDILSEASSIAADERSMYYWRL